jgi:predicted DNA-binding transcriptional regulator YafY
LTAIEVLDEERLRKPAGFDLDTYLRSGALGFGEGNAISLEVLFDAPAADHLYETPLADDQRLTVEPDGRVRVRATVRDTPQLSWWLLGFGAQVEVRKPKSLRTSMAETARAMAAVYRA